MDPLYADITSQPGDKTIDPKALLKGIPVTPGTTSITVKYNDYRLLKQLVVKKTGLVIESVQGGVTEADKTLVGFSKLRTTF